LNETQDFNYISHDTCPLFPSFIRYISYSIDHIVKAMNGPTFSALTAVTGLFHD